MFNSREIIRQLFNIEEVLLRYREKLGSETEFKADFG